MTLRSLFLLCLVTGCSDLMGTSEPTPAETEPTEVAKPVAEVSPSAQAVKAGEIAKKIAANPDFIDATLEEFGMSHDEYLDLLYTIAADPKLTQLYEVARE